MGLESHFLICDIIQQEKDILILVLFDFKFIITPSNT